jgi:choline-sulfatase
LIRESRRLDRAGDGLFRKIQSVYLGMTGYLDYLLGIFLETLEETGYAHETTVFFFSDHGDYAGDYGLVEKWPSACEDVITRVPLIVRAPGCAAGHSVDEPVELFDVMATTLDLAQVEARHTHFARSLVPQLRGASGDPSRAVFTEGGYGRNEPHCFEGRPERDQFARDERNIYYPKGKVQQEHPESVSRAVAVRTATHKLVFRPAGTCELYDLKSDPRELVNLYHDETLAHVRRDLHDRLLDWHILTSDVTPFDMDPRGLPSA